MSDKPGDGKTSPFGDGKGGTQMAPSGGNDFVVNPGGSKGGKGGGQPASYGVSRPQQSGKRYELNMQSAAEGPPTAAEVATPSIGARNGLVATSASSVAHKPFKLSGG